MKKRQIPIENMIHSLARKYNLTNKQITEVEDSMWKFVREQIVNTNTETEKSSNIYLRFLGTIYCPPYKIAKIKEKINGK